MRRYRATFGTTECEVHVQLGADQAGARSANGRCYTWDRRLGVLHPRGLEFGMDSEESLLHKARHQLETEFGSMVDWFINVTNQPPREVLKDTLSG
ncbi:MAG: hypothetical protein ACRD2A_08625 [Vicinamibacterales bacterium]